jgi:hypothetical protein
MVSSVKDPSTWRRSRRRRTAQGPRPRRVSSARAVSNHLASLAQRSRRSGQSRGGKMPLTRAKQNPRHVEARRGFLG